MAATHLAGNDVVIGDRVIQRCLICGQKLCDSLGAMAPINPDGSRPLFHVWEIGAWIEHTGHGWMVVGQTESPVFTESEIPEGCCIALVEN